MSASNVVQFLPQFDAAGTLQLRADLWGNGYRPVAICSPDGDPERSPGKRPLGAVWQLRARQTPPEAAVRSAVIHGPNTGILCDGLRPLDIDFDDRGTAKQLLDLAHQMLGYPIVRTRPNSGKLLALYRSADGEPRKVTLKADAGKIEVLGKGQQFVAFGKHYTGAPLEWLDTSPLECPRQCLTAVTEDQIGAYLTAAAAIVGTSATISRSAEVDSSAYGFKADFADIAAAMGVIPNSGPASWDEWSRVGMALFAATDGEGVELFHAWSELNDSYDAAAVEERWTHWSNVSPPSQIGAGTIFHLAGEAVPGWQKPTNRSTLGAEFGALPPIEPLAGTPEPEPMVVLSEITHTAVAKNFAERFRGRFAYDHSDKLWYQFKEGIGWAAETVPAVLPTIREHIERGRAQWGEKQSEPAGNAAFGPSVASVASSFPEFAVTADMWDTDPMLLGVPGGHVDLRTGELFEADPHLRIKRRCTVAPSGAPRPIWTAFLEQATGGDAALSSWLQRFAGYCLTGDVREEMFAFVYGSGGNGKGTFLNALRVVMGTYAVQAPAELIKANTRTNRETHLAGLVGARLVSASETEAGDSLAEAFVKEITGNEGAISARHLYNRPFQFEFQAKLLIVGNHPPALRGRSEAMERRMRVVPFNHKPAVKNNNLKASLAAEHPQVLSWAIDGAVAWQREGLGVCPAIASASESYFADQDGLAMWIAERCVVSGAVAGPATGLLEDFNQWGRPRGEKPLDARTFKQDMERRPGFKFVRRKSISHVEGIALRGLDD